MLYQKYEDKIKRIAKIKVAVYKFRYPILAGIMLLLILTGWLLIEKGKINSDLVLSAPEIVYGESYECSADVFLGTASYQFKSAGESDAEWVDGLPTAYGEYKIRVKSKRSFGAYSYGEAVDFKITQKPLDIYYDTAVIYGTAPINSENGFSLAKGDRVREFSLTDDVLFVGVTPVGLKSVTIENSDGQDVTYCYAIDYDARTAITVLQKTVTVKTASNSKVYDGTPLSDSGYDEFLLCYKDELYNIDLLASQTNVGNILNSAENIIIKNAQGDDVTDNYYFDEKFGTLTVTPRKITVKPVDITNFYNDEDFTPSEWEILADTTLADGQVVNCYFTGTIKDVGSVTTSISDFKIYADESKTEETTDNYTITKENGTSTVTPRPVKIIDVNKEVYRDDYFKYTKHTYAKDSLEIVSGHTLKLTSKSKVKGEYYGAEVFSFNFYNKDEEIINSANYELDISECALTISPRPATITTYPDSKKYDATPLTNGGYDLAGLVDGHYADVEVIGSITDVVIDDETGEVTGVPNDATYSIFNSEGDVTENYAITEEFGTLKINKRPVTFTLSGKKVYDGKNIINKAHLTLDIWRDDGVGALYNSDKPEYSWEELSSADANDEEYLYYTISSSLICIKSSQDKITNNYDPTWVSGNFTVHKKEITLTAGSKTGEYDRNEHFCIDYTVKDNDGAVEGQKIKIGDDYSKIKEIGEIDNVLSYKIVDVDDDTKDRTKNYIINPINGLLTITERAVTLQLNKKAKYDGTTQTLPTTFKIIEGSLLDGDEISKVTNLICDKTPTFAGTYTLGGDTDNCDIKYKDGEEYTDYYKIIVTGTLTINKARITITTKSATLNTNTLSPGAEVSLTAHEYVINSSPFKTETGFATGDKVEIEYSGIETSKGNNSKNTISSITITYGGDEIADSNGVFYDIDDGTTIETDNYYITVYLGTLTVI